MYRIHCEKEKIAGSRAGGWWSRASMDDKYRVLMQFCNNRGVFDVLGKHEYYFLLFVRHSRDGGYIRLG